MLMRTVDPTITHDEVQQILIDTAVDLGTPGFDHSFGHGRVDAFQALLAVKARLGEPGDVNADESVNEADREALEALLNVEWGQVSYNARADLNHDGFIDAADLDLFDEILPPACLADFVTLATFEPPGDGEVDGGDLAFMLGEWGNNPGSIADIVSDTFEPPGDGMVNGFDLAALLFGWGPCPGGN
jgi:hypothetical protein